MTVNFRADTLNISQVNKYTRWRVKIYMKQTCLNVKMKRFFIYINQIQIQFQKSIYQTKPIKRSSIYHHRYRVLIPDTFSIQINIKRNDVAVFIYIQSPGNMAVECHLRHRLGSGGPDRNHSHPGLWTFVDCLIG